jgi:hypothetical protein
MDENPYQAPQEKPGNVRKRPRSPARQPLTTAGKVRTARFIKAIARVVFVVINAIVGGSLLCLAGLGLSGRLADAGHWENEGYGVLFLLGALVAGVNLLALFPEFRRIRALRWSAYTANTAVVAFGFYLLWGGSVYGAIGGLSSESLLCWGFGSANIMAIAVIGD